MDRRNIYAYTAAGGTYPPYISINAEVDGTISVTVRSAGNWGRDVTTIKLQHERVRELVEALVKELP